MHHNDNNLQTNTEPGLGRLDQSMRQSNAPPTLPRLLVHQIWDLLATGATKVNNINVISGNRPIGDLNLTHHQKAIQVQRAHVKQISQHQYQGTPIIVQASVTMKYCSILAISANRPTPATPGVSPPDNANPQDVKRNPATPEGGKDKDASKQPSKKVRLVKP